jgi:hypothetical protein
MVHGAAILGEAAPELNGESSCQGVARAFPCSDIFTCGYVYIWFRLARSHIM